MADYWVSKKKYFCKYCDIYIADDTPSRQHHESGMRHKGNLERYIRGIYKTGEKKKKDLEEEKREMAAVERAANAAFALDVGAGLAKGSSGPVASTSAAAAATRKPPPKPSNPYANYTTAEQLGISDPDAERMAAERALRQSQGVAGDWEVVATVPSASTSQTAEAEDVKPDVEGAPTAGEKRPADDSEDPHDFRLRKKRLNTGLGEIYDPGLIPIKVKKREEPKAEPSPPPPPEAASSSSETAPSQQLPKWTPLHLKRPGESSNEPAKPEPSEPVLDAPPQEDTQKPTTLKWKKSTFGAPVQYTKPESDTPPVKTEGEAPVPLENAAVKDETPDVSLPPPTEAPGPVFKKRKAPASMAAKGRRF
ncbi:hypothetical protein BKA70DRAFT_1181626 [Coprinopsis sp. MPI-PUGE-AT-0042]|nr:hypothetical protein BKA70DRAFT_1181626 [Coprinopsis sp. MPI-PUGE-AT-0042]